MNYGLNLLPRKAKRDVAFEEMFDRWRGGLLGLVIVLTLLAGGLYTETWLLTRHDDDLKAQLQKLQTELQQKGAVDITRATVEVNNKVTLLGTALTVSQNWAGVLRPILDDLPSGISITSLEITSAGRVTIKGTAGTRAAFLNLQEAMKNTTALTNATTSDTASKRENLPFTYTASLPKKS